MRPTEFANSNDASRKNSNLETAVVDLTKIKNVDKDNVLFELYLMIKSMDKIQ